MGKVPSGEMVTLQGFAEERLSHTPPTTQAVGAKTAWANVALFQFTVRATASPLIPIQGSARQKNRVWCWWRWWGWSGNNSFCLQVGGWLVKAYIHFSAYHNEH